MIAVVAADAPVSALARKFAAACIRRLHHASANEEAKRNRQSCPLMGRTYDVLSGSSGTSGARPGWP
jgi:hypothetical protein